MLPLLTSFVKGDLGNSTSRFAFRGGAPSCSDCLIMVIAVEYQRLPVPVAQADKTRTGVSKMSYLLIPQQNIISQFVGFFKFDDETIILLLRATGEGACDYRAG